MTPVPVEKGMTLIVKDAATDAIPHDRYRIWTVMAVRTTSKGASLRLLNWSPGCTAEATATFPDGLVSEPWQVFALSQRDLALVYTHGSR